MRLQMTCKRYALQPDHVESTCCILCIKHLLHLSVRDTYEKQHEHTHRHTHDQSSNAVENNQLSHRNRTDINQSLLPILLILLGLLLFSLLFLIPPIRTFALEFFFISLSFLHKHTHARYLRNANFYIWTEKKKWIPFLVNIEYAHITQPADQTTKHQHYVTQKKWKWIIFVFFPSVWNEHFYAEMIKLRNEPSWKNIDKLPTSLK